MNPPALPSAWSHIRLALHLLVAALLLLVAVRGFRAEGTERVAVLATTLVTALVYAAGLSSAVRRNRGTALTWLGLLVSAWVALMLLTPDGVWLAFPLFFLIAHALPDRVAVLTVALVTATAILGFGWHEHRLTIGTVLGPVLGALVAVLTVLGLRAVHRESERRGVLEERERLAREIHDTLAQGLSSIHLLLSAAEATSRTDPVEATEHVRRAKEVARDNLEEARRFVRALSPSDLADASLTAALRRLVDKSGGGPVISLDVSGTPAEIPTAYDVALLRIAQAGLANALTHSGAGRVALTLSYMDDEIALDVVDDGRGFDPGALTGPADGRGFGLAAIRSRAEQLGGSFTVESGHGEGTAVAVTFPLTAADGAR